MNTNTHTSSQEAVSSSANGHSPSASQGLPDETLAFAERIFQGARCGDVPLLKASIEAGLPVELTNSSGNNLLMLAAYHGHAELVRLLLSSGAQPDLLNERGQSALAGAVFKGWREVVVALVEGGADVRAGRPNAIDCAYMFKRDDYWSLLGASADDVSPDVPRTIS